MLTTSFQQSLLYGMPQPCQRYNDTNMITCSTLEAYQYMKIHLCSHHPRSLWCNYNSNFQWCCSLCISWTIVQCRVHALIDICISVDQSFKNIWSQTCMPNWHQRTITGKSFVAITIVTSSCVGTNCIWRTIIQYGVPAFVDIYNYKKWLLFFNRSCYELICWPHLSGEVHYMGCLSLTPNDTNITY
jgi:hypothetical protein